MKKYPFNELDYFTRRNEGGFSRLLAFLKQPTDETFSSIVEGVKEPEDFDHSFWESLHRICFSDSNGSEIIHEVLGFCFTESFIKIKNRWYKYMGEQARRDNFVQQCNFSLGVCRSNVYEDPDWQGYHDAYEKSYSEFIERIEKSLHGYAVDRNEANEIPEPVAVEGAVGYKLNCRIGQQHAIIERLGDLLGQHGFTNSTVNDLLPLFVGMPIHNPVVWLGTHGELKYFIKELVNRGCLNITKNDWGRAEHIFRPQKGLFAPKQLADNYTEPTPDRKEILHAILESLHAHGVGKAPK